MTAAVRAAFYVAVGLAALAGMLWAALSPLPPAPAVRLAVMFVTFSGSGVAWEWLGKRRRKEHAMSDGPGLVCPGCGSPDVDLRRGLLCGTCAKAVAAEGGGSGE
jgi:hypothetical protein